MVEYTVILAFAVLLLMGPGGDVLLDLAAVIKNKYRGYSYAMSLSTMPDFDTGPDLRAHIEALNLDTPVDEQTIERLSIDPVQDNITAALEPYTGYISTFNDVAGMLGDLENLDDIALDMARDALSPF